MQNYTKEQISEIYTGWFRRLQSDGRDYNEFANVLIRASKIYFNIDEEWEDIKEYKGLYEISTFGRAKSLDRKFWIKPNNSFGIKKERILKLSVGTDGYFTVGLSKNGKVKTVLIH